MVGGAGDNMFTGGFNVREYPLSKSIYQSTNSSDGRKPAVEGASF